MCHKHCVTLFVSVTRRTKLATLFIFSPKKPKVLHFSPSSNVIYLSFGLRPEHPRRCCGGAPSHSGCDEKLLSRLSSSLKSTKPSPVDFDCTPALSHSCHMCGSYKSAVISLAPLQYTACVAPTLSLAISCAYCPAMATLSEGTIAQHCYSIGRTKPFFFSKNCASAHLRRKSCHLHSLNVCLYHHQSFHPAQTVSGLKTVQLGLISLFDKKLTHQNGHKFKQSVCL